MGKTPAAYFSDIRSQQSPPWFSDRPTMTTNRVAWLFSIAVLIWAASGLRSQESSVAGEALYAKQCASCHGKQGEGTKRHSKPLGGERSLAQLTKLIQETMPEGQPGSLSPEEAQAVAAHVFDRFYSQTAKERNAPARISVVRLTVPQFRNAVADIIASFRGKPRVEFRARPEGRLFQKPQLPQGRPGGGAGGPGGGFRLGHGTPCPGN